MNPSIRTFLFLSIVMLTSTRASAQKDLSYSDSKLLWKDRKITWDDFQGYQPNDSTSIFMKFQANGKLAKKKINGITYHYRELETSMMRDMSWIADSIKTAPMLRYSQMRFDLWELYSRKAIKECDSNPGSDINEVFEFYKRVFDRRCEEAWKETANATDRDKVNELATQAEEDLEETFIDPSQYPVDLTRSWGGTYGIGAMVHIPFSDYVNTMYGIALDMAFLKNYHLFGIDMGLYWGKCQRDFNTSKGPIFEDQSLQGYQIMANYGYNAYRGDKVELTPYIGIGGSGYMHFLDDNDNTRLERNGFSLSVGLITDIVLKRNIYINTFASNSGSRRSMLRIKPFVNFTHYSNPIGWVPSLNLSIEFGRVARYTN